MRVALLASTLTLLCASPAAAQCVYVACGGNVQPPAATYEAPTPAPRAAPGYDEGYAAGLAARPTARVVTRTTSRTQRAHVSQRRAGTGPTAHAKRANSSKRSSIQAHTSTVSRAHASRPTIVRHTSTRAVTRRAVTTTHVHTHHQVTRAPYQDPIKDRASTYRSQTTGQSTTLASMMSSSTAWSGRTQTTWTGPATTVNQGGQVCGWGARIVTNAHGYAQRQAVWVCQCPQGWRPPGY